MINKKLLFIMLTLALIVSIGTISAADINDTTDAQQDTTTISQTTTNHNTIQAKQPTKNINKTIQTKTKEASESVTDYQQLYEKLTDSSAEEDSTITLTGDDTYTITNTITVSESIKNLVINGNGKTIDGNNQHQFMIINHICNVSLNNLTVTRCNFTG